MENKKIIIAIIIVIILIIGTVGGTFWFTKFNVNQSKILTDETNKILQSNIINDNIDFDIKTEKNYAVVEKAVKEYVSKLKNIYVEINELNTGINPNSIFSAQNMQDKDLREVDDIVNDYKEKCQNAVDELEEILTDEKIAENINKRTISSRKEYYTELYNAIMNNDSMKKQYNAVEEKVKDERSSVLEKVNQISKISEFLKKNSDAWTIKDDKIQFSNLNRMTEYYNLINKLID